MYRVFRIPESFKLQSFRIKGSVDLELSYAPNADSAHLDSI